MELFDEMGEKFFYNRKTEESTYDDPRAAMYHELQCKLRMLALMKEHNPVLARAPRPVEETEEERMLRMKQARESDELAQSVLRYEF